MDMLDRVMISIFFAICFFGGVTNAILTMKVYDAVVEKQEPKVLNVRVVE